jgi:nucleoside-diphosphate-sugar epimerase
VRVVGGAAPDAVVHQLTDLPDVLAPGQMAGVLERNARIRDVGTRNLVLAATRHGITRLVAQSIAFAYAPGPRPYAEDAPLDVESSDPVAAATARGVASLERQVLGGDFHGIVLRYGRLYGPGTWFETPPGGGAVHVEAAADAARLALSVGAPGVYNVTEDGGTVSHARAVRELGWDPSFRVR